MFLGPTGGFLCLGSSWTSMASILSFRLEADGEGCDCSISFCICALAFLRLVRRSAARACWRCPAPWWSGWSLPLCSCGLFPDGCLSLAPLMVEATASISICTERSLWCSLARASSGWWPPLMVGPDESAGSVVAWNGGIDQIVQHELHYTCDVIYGMDGLCLWAWEREREECIALRSVPVIWFSFQYRGCLRTWHQGCEASVGHRHRPPWS